MRITVFGATGLVGKYVLTHALAQGHYVTAFGRNIEHLIDTDLNTPNLEAIKGYVFDEDSVLHAIQQRDAVISVLGGSFDGVDKTRSLGIKNIIAQMNKAGVKRIVALGGLGILDDENGNLLLDKPGYPQQYLPVGKEHLQAYTYLKDSNLDWTIIGAPNIIDADATGSFAVAANIPPSPNAGKINAGDLALFMVSELAKNNFVRQRVGISNAS